jgi:hypothetical protein
LRAAIATSKITNIRKINFNIRGIHIPSLRVFYQDLFIVFSSPRLSAPIVTITEVSCSFCSPAVATFFRFLSAEHPGSLYFLVFSVVERTGVIGEIIGINPM